MNNIEKYFPALLPLQRERFAALEPLYKEWNAKINVISRRDMEHFYEHHVLHSLAIGRVCPFPAGAKVMDVGTGGGFPGIPLAILFPEARFWLVDSIGKKITVVREVARALGLDNIVALNARAESVWAVDPREVAPPADPRFDWVVSRAVTDMSTFLSWIHGKIKPGGEITHGLLCLKGGDLAAELATAGRPYTLYDIAELFPLDFFETKRIVRIDF